MLFSHLQTQSVDNAPSGRIFHAHCFPYSYEGEPKLPCANHKASKSWGQAHPKNTPTTITVISPREFASMLQIKFNIKIKVFLFPSSSNTALTCDYFSISKKAVKFFLLWSSKETFLSCVTLSPPQISCMQEAFSPPL